MKMAETEARPKPAEAAAPDPAKQLYRFAHYKPYQKMPGE